MVKDRYWIQDQEFYQSGLLGEIWRFQQQYPNTEIRHWQHWFVHSIDIPQESGLWFLMQFSEYLTPQPPGIGVEDAEYMHVNLSQPPRHIWT